MASIPFAYTRSQDKSILLARLSVSYKMPILTAVSRITRTETALTKSGWPRSTC